jgi:hypothetical protein
VSEVVEATSSVDDTIGAAATEAAAAAETVAETVSDSETTTKE